MGLLNFLYKDESLIASLYAQIFSGRLVAIDKEESSANSENSEFKGGLSLLGGKASWGSNGGRRIKESIDPHDAATLDVLTHLQDYEITENEATPNSIVTISGRIALMDYAQRSCVIESGFESNIRQLTRSMGLPPKQANRLYELAKKGCIGKQEETRFFIKSSSGNWYWGSTIEKNFSPHFDVLQIGYGPKLVPVNMVAILLGGATPDVDETGGEGAPFVRALQNMVSLTNANLIGDGIQFKSALLPIAIILPINANGIEE